jgi:hypothetical protein
LPGADIDRTQLARVADLLCDIAQRTKRREAFAGPIDRCAVQAERLALEATARELSRMHKEYSTLRTRRQDRLAFRRLALSGGQADVKDATPPAPTGSSLGLQALSQHC